MMILNTIPLKRPALSWAPTMRNRARHDHLDVMETALAVARGAPAPKETAEQAAGLPADQVPLADPQPQAEDEVTADHDLRDAPAFKLLPAVMANPSQNGALDRWELVDALMARLQQKVVEIPALLVEHRIVVALAGVEQVEIALALEQLLAPKTGAQVANQVIEGARTLAVEASPILSSEAKQEAVVQVEIFEVAHGLGAGRLVAAHPVVALTAVVERAVRVQQIEAVAAPRTRNVDLGPSDRPWTKRLF
jgi:hypothetical protein